MARLSRGVNLNGANLAKIDGELEVFELCSHCSLKLALQFREGESGDMDRPNVRQIHLARPVYAHIRLKANLPPDPDAQLIAGTDDVVGWDGSQVKRRECGGDLAEEVSAEDGQNLAGAGGDKLLEFGEWLGWRLRLQKAGYVLAETLSI
jgi:hypothetical protein